MLPVTGATLDLTTPSPIRRGRRRVSAFLRGPISGEAVRLGTKPSLRDGVWPFFGITQLPEPTDSANSGDFGIRESGGFSVNTLLPKPGELVDVPDSHAVLLDGATEFISATVPTVLNFGTGSFTIYMRVRHDDFTYPRTSFGCTKQGNIWNVDAGWGIGAGFDPAGQYVFLCDGVNFVDKMIACDAGFRPGHDLRGTFCDMFMIVDREPGSPFQDTVRLAINGQLQADTMNIAALTGSVSNINPFLWGTAVGWMVCGAEDEFQAWRRALTVAECQAIRLKRLKGDEPGLVTYWPCNEGTGNTLQDGSASGNHGTKISTAEWVQGGPLDALDQHRRIEALLHNQQCKLELVTHLLREDGTASEITHQRTAVCRSTVRTRAGVELTFADRDVSALDQVYPFLTYSVDDFAELFIDHVGRRVGDGCGISVKVPLTEIVKTGGTWKYAAALVRSGVPATILTVYRENRVVSGTEWVQATVAAPGYSVHTANFTREQIDPQGRRYTLTADILIGSAQTLASDEVQRLLVAVGEAVAAGSFAAAQAYGHANKMYADAAYVKGRTVRAILQDLLMICRADLRQNAAGQWELVQDRPRASVAFLEEAVDEIDIEAVRSPTLAKTFSLEYRPVEADNEKFNIPPRTRSTAGADGEERIKNPYLRQHETADRLVDYLAKRAAQERASATGWGVQFGSGDVLHLKSYTAWMGVRKFIASGIQRLADRNALDLREYSDAVYAYTPTTLPADPTNGYGPDYSATQPAAPSVGPTYVSGSSGTTMDKDGKITAFAMLRIAVASLPTVNYSRVFALVIDTGNNAQRISELLLNGTNYELRFPVLRVNQAHQAYVFCENANGVKGLASPVTNFTTENDTGLPPTMAQPSVTQDNATSLRVYWGHTTLANRAGYILERSDNGGVTYGEISRLGRDTNTFLDNYVPIGFTFYYRISQVDSSGNVSAASSPSSHTVAAWINDQHIATGGVGNVSMSSNSINTGNLFNSAVTGAKTAVVSSISNYFGAPGGTVLQLTSNQGLWSTVSRDEWTCIGGGGPSSTKWRNDGGTMNVTTYENFWL